MEFDVIENRRINLSKIADLFRNKADLARAMKRKPQQIHGLLGGTKPFGYKLARDTEAIFQLPGGTLDRPDWDGQNVVIPQSNDVFIATSTQQQVAADVQPQTQSMTIPVLDVEQVDGLIETPEQATSVENIQVNRAWLYAQALSTTAPQGLRILTAPGDSMSPTISNADMVIVDTQQNTFASEGVYAFQYKGKVEIKRIQVIDDDRVRLISDNEKYIPLERDPKDIVVVGRCLMVLNAREL